MAIAKPAVARLSFLPVVFVLFCLPTGLRAAEKWIVGRSQHFEMYSSASESESQHVLQSLEQFRTNFLTQFPLRSASEPRATVMLFGSDSAFRPFKPLYNGKPKDVAGYFIPGSDELTIAMTTDVPDPNADPTEVIYHEYIHLLLDVREARIPLWLNEGLAEVYSTFRIENGKVEYGAAKERHVVLLQHSPLLPFKQLFEVTHESPDYNEDGRIGIFYAESWALTHYLLYGEDRGNAKKLAQFIQLLGHGSSAEASFREAFGMDYAAMENALRRYLDGGGYYKRRTPAVAADVPIQFRQASDDEREFALLNLRWRIHQDADVAGRALALASRSPAMARPQELLAAIAASAGDVLAAQEHWKRAADLQSDNPWVYTQLLHDQLSAYEGATILNVRLSDDQIAAPRQWAARALALSPENPSAIELAAVTEAIAEKMDLRVINRIQRRVTTMRDPARALLALAIIHWRSKDLGSAQTLVNLVLNEPRADLNTRAAAEALRDKFPVVEQPTSAVSADELAALAAKNGIALQSARVGQAGRYLDQLLSERGTTAPRYKLPPVLVEETNPNQPDAWRTADELRKRAATGEVDAMFDLAVAHACGSGAAFSPTLAAEWLQKAFDHGHPLAKAGAAPAKMEPELVAQFLRDQRPISAGTPVPPLEPELQRRIHDAATAEPRHDPLVIFAAATRFPDDLKRADHMTEAVLQFTIAADGHPVDIQALHFSDTASAMAAADSIRGWRFIPAIRDGKPTRTYAEIRFTFAPIKAPARPPRA